MGISQTTSRVVYWGTQRLMVERQGKQTRYDAQARYTRSAAGAKTVVHARFVQQLSPAGTFEDVLDEDPDFLTILNQPFAVQLDSSTLHDLKSLHGSVPFGATSPLGGDTVLRGQLRPGVGGEIGGRPSVAVRFEAEGPMNAPVPDHAQATMDGHMRMDGTAYYAVDNESLLALDATLTILAQLHDGKQIVPVKITYRRYIRASVPQPTPLPSDGGKALRSAR